MSYFLVVHESTLVMEVQEIRDNDDRDEALVTLAEWQWKRERYPNAEIELFDASSLESVRKVLTARAMQGKGEAEK